MNKKLILWGIILIITISIIINLSNLNITGYFIQNNVNTNKILIGVISPLSGPAANYGLESQLAINLAIEEINESGGINGRQIKLIYEDGKANGKDAVTAIQKLIQTNNVKIIIGGFASSESLAITQIAEKNKIILFSPGSTAPDLTFAGDYFFRTVPSDNLAGKVIANKIMEDNIDKISIISAANSDYSQGIKNAFEKEYVLLGGKIINDEKYNLENNTDIKTQIIKIKNNNPKAIFIAGDVSDHFITILKQLKELNYTGKIYTIDAMISQKNLNDNRKLYENIIFEQIAFDKNNTLAEELFNKIKIKYNKAPDVLPAFYYASSYDEVYIIKDAIIECKSEKNTDCIKKYLYTIKNRKGAIGNLTIDEYGDAILDYEIKIIKNGKIESIK